jgi:phosphatidylserine decarboxylase
MPCRIKGDQFTVANVFAHARGKNGTDLAPIYENGSLVIARLAPQDYHRWHVPASGVLLPHTEISGALFTVNPIAVNANVNVYTQNKREIHELNTMNFGKIVIVPVGATMVGSIKHINKTDRVKKGDPHGFFAFGGSTVLLFFEPGAIQFDSDLVENSKKKLETLLKVNTRIGCSTGVKAQK